jgi:hypothetical protein
MNVAIRFCRLWNSIVTLGTMARVLRTSAKRTMMRRFSASVSTEEHHTSKKGGLFCGAYGHIRKMLDYTYHAGTYNKERQFLHDSIIEGTYD